MVCHVILIAFHVILIVCHAESTCDIDYLSHVCHPIEIVCLVIKMLAVL